MPDLARAGFPVSICYADEQAGALIAGVPRLGPEITGHYRMLLSKFTGDAPVRFVRCGLARRHLAKREYRRPLVGGLGITARISDTHSELGTICVCAVRGGQTGFVTAGHVVVTVGRVCYQPRMHDANNWAAGTATVISNYTAVADSDSAFLDDATGGNLTRNSIWKSPDQRYTVTGTATPALGDMVYMQGAARAAERSGQICATGATVTFDDWGTLNNQYLAVYRSHSGDSGAPVYVKDANPNVRLVGLNVGDATAGDINPPVDHHTYPPPQPGDKYAVISKWASIEADLGVTR